MIRPLARWLNFAKQAWHRQDWLCSSSEKLTWYPCSSSNFSFNSGVFSGSGIDSHQHALVFIWLRPHALVCWHKGQVSWFNDKIYASSFISLKLESISSFYYLYTIFEQISRWTTGAFLIRLVAFFATSAHKYTWLNAISLSYKSL